VVGVHVVQKRAIVREYGVVVEGGVEVIGVDDQLSGKDCAV